MKHSYNYRSSTNLKAKVQVPGWRWLSRMRQLPSATLRSWSAASREILPWNLRNKVNSETACLPLSQCNKTKQNPHLSLLFSRSSAAIYSKGIINSTEFNYACVSLGLAPGQLLCGDKTAPKPLPNPFNNYKTKIHIHPKEDQPPLLSKHALLMQLV